MTLFLLVFSHTPWSTIGFVYNLVVSSWMRHGGLFDANGTGVTEMEEWFLVNSIVDDERLGN